MNFAGVFLSFFIFRNFLDLLLVAFRRDFFHMYVKSKENHKQNLRMNQSTQFFNGLSKTYIVYGGPSSETIETFSIVPTVSPHDIMPDHIIIHVNKRALPKHLHVYLLDILCTVNNKQKRTAVRMQDTEVKKKNSTTINAIL